MDEKQQQFVDAGRGALTGLSLAIDQLAKWTAAFEARGGGAVFGNDAALIAAINNKVQTTITIDDLATVARLRMDI